MSDCAWARRLVLVLFLVLPLPMVGLEGSVVPVARFVQLAVGLSVLGALEGTQGMVGLFLGLLWGHVLVYGLLLLAGVAVLRRVAGALVPGDRASWVFIVLSVLAIGWAFAFAEYDTQFHHTTVHASFAELYR